MTKTKCRYDSASLRQLGRLGLELHAGHALAKRNAAQEERLGCPTSTKAALRYEKWKWRYGQAFAAFSVARQHASVREATVRAWVGSVPFVRSVGRKGLVRALLALHLVYVASGLASLCFVMPVRMTAKEESACFSSPCACGNALRLDAGQAILAFQVLLFGFLSAACPQVVWADRGWISSARAQNTAAVVSVAALLLGTFFAVFALSVIVWVRATYGPLASSCMLSGLF